MTILGYDLSSFQHGTDVAALPGDFIILKCTEGTYYADADYLQWAPSVHGAGKIVVPYHFLKTESSARDQVLWLSAHIGNRALPFMLDVEPSGASRPDLGLTLQVIDAARAYGLNPRLVYLPEWYWSQIGAPSLEGLAARGIGLVSSNYPGGSDYPGDVGPGWRPYGGVMPMIWQYTDKPIDRNAYRGTADQLRNFLEGTDVNLTDTVTISGGFAARYPQTAPDGFTAGANVPVSVLLEGAAIRAANNEHLLETILAKVGAPAPVDVNALAAALIPHLPPSGDPQAVALAVVNHLGLQVVAK